MSTSTSRRTTVPSMGCGYLFCLALGVGGLALLFAAQRNLERQRRSEAWVTGGFGVALTVGALALIAPMQREVARAKERRRREEARPDEPWTWEPAWTAPGGIVQSGRRGGRVLVGFAIVALGLSLPAMLAFDSELRRGNHLVWLALVFPLVCGGILALAARDAWRKRKYGVARFVPASVPVPLGGELAGMVFVSRPVTPIVPGRVSLLCWRSSITRSGSKRTQRDEVVGRTEREISAADWSTTAGESRLLVQLPVRGGRASTLGRAELDRPAFEWRLRVEVPTAGADFVAEFVLPVFGNSDTAGAQGNSDDAVSMRAERPATRSGRAASADRAEVFRAAGIQEEAQAGAVRGTALRFRAGAGRSLATAPLIVALVLGAMAGALWLAPVPGFVAVFVALFALIPVLIVKALWTGGGERIWVEADAICVEKSAAVRRIARGDVQRIESNRNVGAGEQQFYRIVARVRPRREGFIPPRAVIASLVRGDEATAHAVEWIEERLTSAA